MNTSQQEHLICLRQEIDRQQKTLTELAQATWATTKNQDNFSAVDQHPEQLIEILDLEAQRQATLGNIQTSWIIRQHIRKITPNYINNLLHLIQLSIDLEIFTPDLLREWQVVELMRQGSFTTVDAELLLQVFAKTTQLHLKLDQEYLQALNYVSSSNTYAEHRQKIQEVLNQFVRPYKLNIGCGKVKFAGWINIDIDEKLDTVDLVWDITHGLPFTDGSCQIIYHEHMLEHLPVEKGVSFLTECYRVLQVGGVLRVAMPSLDLLYETATSLDWQNQDWLKWPEYEFIKTRAEMLNVAFRWWGHQWLYDREELQRRLQEAGFINIEFAKWGCSDLEELRNRETRLDSLLICEARK